jgi:DNA-binding response OmpR family regulator
MDRGGASRGARPTRPISRDRKGPNPTITTATPQAHILLVYDDEYFLFQHRIRLEHAGFTVTTASSRTEAETLAGERRPDLAIVDLMMDEADDGFILAHHLKDKMPGLPIILVTAVTAETGLSFVPATAAEQVWVAADVVLAKPVRFDQLRGEIERLLKR